MNTNERPPGGFALHWRALETSLLQRVPLDEETRRRARGLLITGLLIVGANALWLPYMLVDPRGWWVLLLMMMGASGALVVLRLTGRTVLVAHLIASIVSLTLALSGRYFWGGSALPVLMLLSFAPSVAGAFGGRKTGLFWIAVSLVIIAGQALTADQRTAVELSPTLRLLIESLVLGTFVVVWGTLVLVFERLHSRTRARIQETAIRAEAASKAKDEFLATISHELRTPMNGVLGMLELLLLGGLEGEKLAQAREAHHSAELLLALLNDVLDFSKLEAGMVRLDPVSTDIIAVSEGVVALMRGRASEKNLELALHVAPLLPRLVMADGGRLRQVLLNLVANAVKFTQRGQVRVDLAGEADEREVRLVVRVEDTGIGIPADKLEVIFEAFTQADGSTTRNFGGTGLGLTIARRIVDAMGGTLRVTSQLGRGACFEVRLTLARDLQPPVWPVAPLEVRALRQPGAAGGLRVLLADDDRISQQVARRLLERLGCQVDLAANGREAVELARRSRYQLVLLDCHMPELDGFSAAKAIRQLEGEMARVPIVALTADAFIGSRERALAAGMNDHLTKPVRPQLLEAALERWAPLRVRARAANV